MSEWIAVCGEEGGNPIEIETEEDGTLLLEELTALFPGTTTLKYRSRDSNAFRSVKCSKGVLKAPGGKWDHAPIYICVNPTKPETVAPAVAVATKRSHSQSMGGMVETGGKEEQAKRLMADYDPLKCTDLIVLGLKPTTTSATIQEHFEAYGEVVMAQTKNSKDKNVAFAFIRFADKATERKVLKEKHQIEDRECTVRIPDSQQGDKSLRKIYVSYHSQSIKEKDFTEHFEKYGDIVEVFIPNPWRHFCFVTFYDARVAQSLIGKEHDLNGVSLLIKSAGGKQGKQQEQMDGNEYANMFRKMNESDGGQGGWGGQGGYGGQGSWGPGQGGPWPGMPGGNMGGNANMMPMGGGGGPMGPTGPGGPNNMGGPNTSMGPMGQGWAGSQNYGYGGGNPGPVPPPQQQGYGQQQQQQSNGGQRGGSWNPRN